MTPLHLDPLESEGNQASTEAEDAPEICCQYCRSPLRTKWADLGAQPLANDYMPSRAAARAEPTYPLHARFCDNCFLVQVDRVVPPETIFGDYPYFSSNSASWLDHCERYAAKMIERFSLGSNDLVVEIASNDGYLLQYFMRSGVPVLGIEPAANVALAAIKAGIPTEVLFFGEQTARQLVAGGLAADHLSAKNVLAHVPDIGDFARGVATILKPEAVFTVEFPHLLRTIEGLQFDQIYHEHFSYLSLLAVSRILSDQGLRVFDVEQLETHGGSLRVYACHDGAHHETTSSVQDMLDAERAAQLDRPEGYHGFEARMQQVRGEFLAFLEHAHQTGKVVAGYGAAAKGNTFLNYCGLAAASLPFIVDRSPAKVGRFMPGSGVKILDVQAIDEVQPDYLLVLSWNLRQEIMSQMASISDWGGKFVTAIPYLQIF
ncbi:MAG: methyltransferase domain-containing protein [Porphyrobacter sp.]|nr:methyltransferase domain-containing protein [Porphyrobacter sp.]